VDAEEVWRTIGEMLARIDAKRPDEAAALRETLDGLIAILSAGGALNEGHKRILNRLAQHARPAPRVKLRLLGPDKRTVPRGDIDCDALLDLCQARCCAFAFALSPQDLDERVVKWNLDDPYMIKQERDGYCTHLDRARRGGCTIYDDRPVPCREYDCRGDARVWIDFERRIPAPMPEGVVPVRKA
jgi:Fe-S-cluster containining protein